MANLGLSARFEKHDGQRRQGDYNAAGRPWEGVGDAAPPFLGRTNNKYITHIPSPCSSVSASQDARREITEETGNCCLVA
jgi:hypothetical protein